MGAFLPQFFGMNIKKIVELPPARNPSTQIKNSNKQKAPVHRSIFSITSARPSKMCQATNPPKITLPGGKRRKRLFPISLSSPRPESLIAAKPSGMVSWNNSQRLGCMGTWVSGYSQPLGIALGFFCPNFRSFY